MISAIWHCMSIWIQWWIGAFFWMVTLCALLGAIYTCGTVVHKAWTYWRRPRGSSF